MTSVRCFVAWQVRLLLEWGAEVMVIDNKGKLPLHLVGQSASQKNRGKSEDIIKLLKSKMPEDDDQGGNRRRHKRRLHVSRLNNWFVIIGCLRSARCNASTEAGAWCPCDTSYVVLILLCGCYSCKLFSLETILSESCNRRQCG